jgi:hypothetical protein
MPEMATTTISAAVFEPVATVMVVDVVLTMSAVRTNTDMISALVFLNAVPISVYVPEPLLSEHVGDAFVFPEVLQKTISRSPTAGVIATVRLDVPEVPPPAALVRNAAMIQC